MKFYSIVAETVYGKIIFVVNYGNRMGLLLECDSSSGSVDANKSNWKENVQSQLYMIDVNMGIYFANSC